MRINEKPAAGGSVIFYYPASRAHHAYVMSLDFGMKFTKRDGFWTPEGLLTITGAGGYKIEVAEESLGLLEPQPGDIGEEGEFVFKYGGFIGGWNNANWDRPVYPDNAAAVRIIRRDGLPFYWPEQERAEAV